MYEKVDEEEQAPAIIAVPQRRMRAVSLPASKFAPQPLAPPPIAASMRRRDQRKNSLTGGCVDKTLLPPVTRMSLRELEVAALQGNLQLKHDLMLDPQLKLKLRPASDCLGPLHGQYWAAFESDFEICMRERCLTARIALFLSEVKDVMLGMYPNSPLVAQDLAQITDLQHIRQQLQHGSFDVHAWIAFLGYTMKTNCAPKRDGQVDAMLAANDAGRFVDAAKMIMALLEGMKLDLANYHLVRLRPVMMRDLIRGERAIPIRDVSALKRRLKGSRSKTVQGAAHRIIVEAVVDGTEPLETMALDQKRLSVLREEFRVLCIRTAMRRLSRSVCQERIVDVESACALSSLPRQTVQAALNPRGPFYQKIKERLGASLISGDAGVTTLSASIEAILQWHLTVHAPLYLMLLSD